MSIYAIILNEPNAHSWETVKQGWPNRHYILTDRIAFVSADEYTLTHEIAAAVGMDKEQRVSGIVIEAENRGGFNDSGLVEWLSKFS